MNFGASRIGFWYVDPFSFEWSFSQFGIVPDFPGGWYEANRGKLIRFDVQDSLDCGGFNSERQFGTATATINSGLTDIELDWSLQGVGEAESDFYEQLNLSIQNITDGGGPITVTRAKAPGGGLGCQVGNVVVEDLVAKPYTLLANKNYLLRINFDTVDQLFHIGCYYQISFQFRRVI